jgi:acetyl-CoA acetyltransferase
MRRAAIVSPIRTAVGKFMGALSAIPAGELGAVVLKALIARTGVDPERIDDVVFARATPTARRRASRAGRCWRPTCRSAFRGCSSTAAAAAACRR